MQVLGNRVAKPIHLTSQLVLRVEASDRYKLIEEEKVHQMSSKDDGWNYEPTPGYHPPNPPAVNLNTLLRVMGLHLDLHTHIIFPKACHSNASPKRLVIRHPPSEVADHMVQRLIVDRHVIRRDAVDLVSTVLSVDDTPVPILSHPPS
jgi:hypothetical protein